jgi:hypothetical protein
MELRMPENDIPPKANQNLPPESTPPRPGAPAKPVSPVAPAAPSSPPARVAPKPNPNTRTNPTPRPGAKAPAKQPSAYDEFGTAKRNLPPALPVAIAILLVAVVVGLLAYVNRAKPAAQGSITGVWFSQPANLPNPMILAEVTLHNTSDKTIYIKNIRAAVETGQGEQADDATPASDYDRYFMAYPDLRGHAAPLRVEMKIPPGAEQKGAVMVSLPVTQQQFDARKDVTVTIEPYDQQSIVLHEKAAAK